MNDTPQTDDKAKGSEEASNIIRARIDELYSTHAQNPPQAKPKESLLQRFWELHGDADDHHSAWEVFYASLPSDEKHQLWNEYHQTQFSVSDTISSKEATPQAPIVTTTPPDTHTEKTETKPATATDTPKESTISSKPAAKRQKSYDTFAIPGAAEPPQPKPQPVAAEEHPSVQAQKQDTPPKEIPKTVAETKQQLLKGFESANTTGKSWFSRHRGAIITSLIVMSTILALNYNQVAIAAVKKYVSPGSEISSPIIIDPNASIDIGEESRIIIPKINVDVPVVYDITTYEESAIQEGLERGVVHYGETALPGQNGNNVIVGHSSSNFFNGGQYKFAFVLLDRLELNDTFILHFEGVRYVYRITNKQIIDPSDFSLVQPTAVPTTTLITCSPPGTNWERLVIQAEQITPDVSENTAASEPIPVEQQDIQIVPGNAPSLWQRATDWLF